MNFYNKHLLNDFYLKKQELLSLIELNKKKTFLFLYKENICIINEKKSLRTINSLINIFVFFKINFTIINNIHNFKKENIKDFSRTLGLLYNYVFYRGNNEIILKLLAKYSGSIILNLLSNGYHPFQVFSDISLINNLIIFIIGNFNSNVFKSLIINLSKLNKIIIIFSPKIYWNYIFLKKIFNKKKIILTEKILLINKKIFIYSDVWFSMGENIFFFKINKLLNYKINKKIFFFLKIKKIFHCLPCNKKIFPEIEENIFESKYSIFNFQIINKMKIFQSYLFIIKKNFFLV